MSRRTSSKWKAGPREGNDWLAAQTGYWPIGNNLVHHLWWHRALMQLDLGERDAVLASYDANIRNLNAPMTKAAPDQFNDLQNATALLWRLEQLGLDVGGRWDELADKAEARIGDSAYLLLPPHLMLALAATGRDAAAARFLAALREQASRQSRWDAAAIARRRRAGVRGRPGPPARPARARRCSAGATSRPHPPARRQQRPARPVPADPDQFGNEGGPPRCRRRDDRRGDRDPCRSANPTCRLRRPRRAG